MEVFEKAHVLRMRSKKSKKLQGKVKGQLKQMLYGYKQSDNEIIKHCATSIDDTVESSSVSGFSDLNLTNSDKEPDTLLDSNDGISETINDREIESDPNISNESGYINQSVKIHYEDPHRGDGSPRAVSTSEDDNIIMDIDSYNLRNRHIPKCSDVNIVSTASSSFEMLTDNEFEDDMPFDADGTLAEKILKKIKKTQKVQHKTDKSKQRKEEKCYVEIDKLINENLEEYGQIHISEDEFETMDIESLEDSLILLSNSSYEGKIRSINSPPFVSVKATEMEEQFHSFSGILGNYRYHTMKNIPSVNKDLSTEMLFSVENEYTKTLTNIKEAEVRSDQDKEATVDVSFETNDINATSDVFTDSTIDHMSSINSTINKSESISEKEDTNTDFINPIKVFYGKKCCVFVLKYPTEIFIHGKVKVNVLGGTVEVQGYTLTGEPCEIYAPNYSCAQCLRIVNNQNAYYGLFGKLTGSGLSVIEAEEIVTTIGEQDGVLSLQPLKSSKMDFVENYFTTANIFSKQAKYLNDQLKKASDYLGCSIYSTRPQKIFEENIIWNRIVRSGLYNQSRGIVSGGKGVGKSTLLRYYVNRLLEQGPVLVVDLDPGQCEFTVAGNISATVVDKPLLGPNFTHLKMPDMMLNIGMISTMDNPKRYATAVVELITYCFTCGKYEKMPWIINTMGMTNAMGLTFMTLIILLIKPTFLVQINSKSEKKRFSVHFDPNTVKDLYINKYQNNRLFLNIECPYDLTYTFYILDNAHTEANKGLSLAPRDERYLNFLAYFGELMETHNGPGLLGITPYEVKLSSLNVATNVRIDGDAVAKVLNGKVIALCQQAKANNNGGKVYALADKPLLCHGHGLVRGIDYEKGVMYVITPTPVQKLPSVDTVVYADWVPELRGQEQHAAAAVSVPYRTNTHYDQRQLMFAPRRRFNPLQLLKMSRI